jgi:hypothetical protein
LRKLITRIIIQILPYGQGCWKIGNTREEEGNARQGFYQGEAFSVRSGVVEGEMGTGAAGRGLYSGVGTVATIETSVCREGVSVATFGTGFCGEMVWVARGETSMRGKVVSVATFGTWICGERGSVARGEISVCGEMVWVATLGTGFCGGLVWGSGEMVVRQG